VISLLRRQSRAEEKKAREKAAIRAHDDAVRALILNAPEPDGQREPFLSHESWIFDPNHPSNKNRKPDPERKSSVNVTAARLTEDNHADVLRWVQRYMARGMVVKCSYTPYDGLNVVTRNGTFGADLGDWVVLVAGSKFITLTHAQFTLGRTM
jgi:hypothetical protein